MTMTMLSWWIVLFSLPSSSLHLTFFLSNIPCLSLSRRARRETLLSEAFSPSVIVGNGFFASNAFTRASLNKMNGMASSICSSFCCYGRFNSRSQKASEEMFEQVLVFTFSCWNPRANVELLIQVRQILVMLKYWSATNKPDVGWGISWHFLRVNQLKDPLCDGSNFSWRFFASISCKQNSITLTILTNIVHLVRKCFILIPKA